MNLNIQKCFFVDDIGVSELMQSARGRSEIKSNQEKRYQA